MPSGVRKTSLKQEAEIQKRNQDDKVSSNHSINKSFWKGMPIPMQALGGKGKGKMRGSKRVPCFRVRDLTSRPHLILLPAGSGTSYLTFCILAQRVKNLPAMQETWIRSLGWEDPLKEGMATHSSTLAWRIPTDRGAWWLQSTGLQRVGHDWVTKDITQHFLSAPSSRLLTSRFLSLEG